MTQTNGHPTTPPVTPPPPNPEPKVLKRVLFVEETTSDGMREVWEVTDEMLTEECLRRGLLTDAQCEEMLSGNYADSGPANESASDTERPHGPHTTPTCSAGNPCDWCKENGKPLGPAKEKKSLRQAVEARVGGQFHSIGDAAMAKLNALIEVLEERLP